MGRKQSNPAELHVYDPEWPRQAQRRLDVVRERLADIPGAADARYDHIGSTAVPGLAAKPNLDLQIRILPLPADDALSERLGDLGYVRARGARPDSPGVYRDIPRGSEVVDDAVWEKSIFVHRPDRVIVHVRRSDSPWGRYAVWFRDWLRAHPGQRDRYEATKRRLSEENAGKDDYDVYTRAKTEFFDEVQAEFERWAHRTRDAEG
ncbi:GrpB family protein [Brachybacterium sacelli]|uniref:Dephospho-CoA kinase n=1 Tax=Brachybacterium sacelli TaxID=173364 RepID=A0ABS4X1M1_9MICO|nr:GrpB family protein [Brachybacterium sacelli]MBP2382337.1 dephospho-CoA kinase [Brachybacterium sacelli]